MASQKPERHAEPTPIRRPRADQARLVADVLRHQIHAGGYSDGLPGEQDLASEFFVSRNTVREALAALKDEGLIDRGPRTGTHVAIRKYDHGLDALVGLKETFKGYGEIRNEVRATMTVAAPPSVANRLQLNPSEPVVFIERLRYLGDLPLSLDMTYLAPDIGRDVIEHSLEVNDVFALIEQVTGRRLGGAGVAVESVAADAHSAAILQVPDGAPVLLWSGSPIWTTADPSISSTSACVGIESPCAAIWLGEFDGPGQSARRRAGDHRRIAVHRGLHAVRRDLSARLIGHQPRERQGLHARRRVLVLRPVRRALSHRRRHRQHALSPSMTPEDHS